jgi:phage-related protein
MPLEDQPQKRVKFEGTSLKDIRDFPPEARASVGRQLRRVQKGLMPEDFDYIQQVGPGTIEIRIRLKAVYRVFYVAKFDDIVYVLHAFNKKSKTGKETPQPEIDTATRRYKELTARRQAEAAEERKGKSRR